MDDVILDSVAAGGDPFDDVVETGEFSEEIFDANEGEADGDSGDSIEESGEVDDSDDSEVETESGEENTEDNSEDVEKESEATEEVAAKSEEAESSDEVKEEAKGNFEDVKINGEIKQFSREEVIAKGKEMLSGEIQWNKKFTELDNERRQYKEDVANISGEIAAIGDKFKEGDAIGAMQLLGKHTKMPPYMIKEQLLQQALPELLKRQDMAPHEVTQEILNAQNEYNKIEKESDDKLLEEKQVSDDLQNQIYSLRQTHDITVEDWNEHLNHLQNTVEDASTITPESIQGSILDFRRYERSEGILKDFGLNENEDSISDLNDVQKRYPEFSDEQLKEVVKIAVDQQKNEKTVSKLAGKVEKQKTAKTVVSNKQKIEESNPEQDAIDDFFF